MLFFTTYLVRTGWFELNARYVFPGECPRRFFDSDREILHVFYVPLRRSHLSFLFFVFVPLICVSSNFLENVDHLRPNIFGEKKRKEKKRKTGLGMGM